MYTTTCASYCTVAMDLLRYLQSKDRHTYLKGLLSSVVSAQMIAAVNHEVQDVIMSVDKKLEIFAQMLLNTHTLLTRRFPYFLLASQSQAL